MIKNNKLSTPSQYNFTRTPDTCLVVDLDGTLCLTDTHWELWLKANDIFAVRSVLKFTHCTSLTTKSGLIVQANLYKIKDLRR